MSGRWACGCPGSSSANAAQAEGTGDQAEPGRRSPGGPWVERPAQGRRAEVKDPGQGGGAVCRAPETVSARRERLQPGHSSPPVTPGEWGAARGSPQAERTPQVLACLYRTQAHSEAPACSPTSVPTLHLVLGFQVSRCHFPGGSVSKESAHRAGNRLQ